MEALLNIITQCIYVYFFVGKSLQLGAFQQA